MKTRYDWFGLPILFASGLLLISACTQLETTPGLTPDGLQSSPLDGGKGKLQLLTYSVPAAQFKISVKTRAAACDAGSVTLSEIQVTLETQYNAGEKFAIDYEKLAGFTKTTSISTGLYANGTLKSINAESSDQTVQTATAVVKLVATVAALGGKQAGGAEDPRCVVQRKRLVAEAPLKTARDNLDSQIALLVTNPQNPDAAEATEKKLDALTKIRDAITTQITTIESKGWESADTTWPANPTDRVTLNQDVGLSVGKLDQLHLMLTRIEEPAGAVESYSAPDMKAKSFPGLVWRKSYRSKLVVAWCGDGLKPTDTPFLPYSGCPSISGTATVGSVLASTEVQVPQSGPFFVIPLKNGVGGDNTIGVTFLQDGSIETASYGDKNAVGIQIATSGNDLANAAAGLRAPNQQNELSAQKSCLDAVDGLRKSEAAVADILGNKTTDESKFAAYAAKCLE